MIGINGTAEDTDSNIQYTKTKTSDRYRLILSPNNQTATARIENFPPPKVCLSVVHSITLPFQKIEVTQAGKQSWRKE